MAQFRSLVCLACLLLLSSFSLVSGNILNEDPFKTRFVWIGDTTTEGFRIHLDLDADDVELLVSTDVKSPESSAAFKLAEPFKQSAGLDLKVYGNLRRIQVTGLEPGTLYYVFIVRSGGASKYSSDSIRVASVRTFTSSVSGGVILGLGSCQSKPGDSEALGEINLWRQHYAQKFPNATFIMVHTGDLHYGDIGQNEPKRFESLMRRVVTDEGARGLFTNAQVTYTWDDHDFGPNNADGSSPSKPAAMLNYRSMVPHPSGSGGVIWHAYTANRVRIVVTDLRSESSRKAKRLMSEAQEKFLLEEFSDWRLYSAIVWVNSRPWISKEKQGSDTWGGYSEQRRRIANHIAKEAVGNLIVVSGDAHMLAADDGTHSMYAESTSGRGFPVLQAAPLAQIGSSKGGPYSQGCHSVRLRKNRQYGIAEILPNGRNGAMKLSFNGYEVSDVTRWQQMKNKEPVIELQMISPFLAKNSFAGGGTGSCSITMAPWYAYLVPILLFTLIIALCVQCCCFCRRRKK